MNKIKGLKYLKIASIFLGIIILVKIFLVYTYSSEKIAYFDMGKSIIEIKYEGDCGATCPYGDINVYQKSKKLFTKSDTIFTLKETSPDGYEFTKLNQAQIKIYKKSGQDSYCTEHPNNEFCVEKKYIVEVK